MGEDQVLHDEFDVDDAARIPLEVEFRLAVRGMVVEHALAHREDSSRSLARSRGCARISRRMALEALADGSIAGDEAGVG